ncbi:nitric oxide-associated protein 1 [Hyalella azteca]|uniref:Nitric oxide-associated protein 1 n=1 Tax=Hyalella azteca TaxID=294128 RepID=A0A8B7NEB4_HYAAZ|nr:nitric oxide-associated protein 1 [Hyalella azteca]
MPDVFKESPGAPGPAPTKGISDNNPRYRSKKWVHDTPGVVQPDQLVSLLTHEELQEALPQSPIVPQTFRVRRGTSLLLGGLARLDILYVHHPVPRSRRLKPSDYVLATVFRSNALPVSVIRTVEASAFYRDNLGGKLLGVPRHGGEMLGTPYPERELLGTPRPGGERLKFWPPLLPSDTFRVTGVTNLLPLPRGARLIASADLVLSSAGWVSLAVTPFSVCEVRLWTPGGRGMYLRSPSFLPHAPLLRGRRAPGCVDYEPHQQPDPAEPPEPSDIFRSSPQNYAKYLGLLDDAE